MLGGVREVCGGFVSARMKSAWVRTLMYAVMLLGPLII